MAVLLNDVPKSLRHGDTLDSILMGRTRVPLLLVPERVQLTLTVRAGDITVLFKRHKVHVPFCVHTRRGFELRPNSWDWWHVVHIERIQNGGSFTYGITSPSSQKPVQVIIESAGMQLGCQFTVTLM